MSNPDPAKMPDLSAWLTKTEAAAVIGVSVRTVETLAADGKLHTAGRPQPGARPAAVYHPEDVERIRLERQPNAYVVPPPAASRSSAETTRTDPGVPETSLARREIEPVFAALAEAFAQFSQTAARPAETPPLFLSVREASRLTGLTQRYIRELLDKGRLEGIQDGRRLRIRRKDLEGL